MSTSTSMTVIAAALAALSQACTGGTTGPRIPEYAERRTAVIALDLQRDFLEESGRMPIDRAQTASVIEASNDLVDNARAVGVPVVYVGNEFARSDWLANWWRNGAALSGSDGAKIDPRVHVVSETYFPKDAPDAFTNPAFDAWLRKEHISELIVSGVFANACVRATVLGARNRGYRVIVVRDAVGAGSDGARDRALAELAKAGAEIASVKDVTSRLQAK